MMKNLLGVLLMVVFSVGAINAQDAEKTAASLYNEGLGLLKEKKYAEGLPLLEMALEKATADNDEKVMKLAKKNGAIATYNVGNVKRKAGQLDEALAMYKRGVELMPAKATNHGGIAMVLDKQDKKGEAMAKYLEAATIAETSGKAKQAVKFVKKARNIVGKKYTSKDYAAAIEMGKTFLAANQNADVNYYVSRSLSKTDAFDDAVTYADKAIELAGEDKQDKFFVAKATALEGKGDKAGAVDAYKMVTGEKYMKMATQKISLLSGK